MRRERSGHRSGSILTSGSETGASGRENNIIIPDPASEREKGVKGVSRLNVRNIHLLGS